MDDTNLLEEGIISETADETAEETQSELDEATLYKQQLEEERQKNKRLYASLGKVNKEKEELASKLNTVKSDESNSFDENSIRQIVIDQNEKLRAQKLEEKQKEAFLKTHSDAWDHIDKIEKISKTLDLSFEEAYRVINPNATEPEVKTQSVKMSDWSPSTGKKSLDKMSKEEKMKIAEEYLNSLWNAN